MSVHIAFTLIPHARAHALSNTHSPLLSDVRMQMFTDLCVYVFNHIIYCRGVGEVGVGTVVRNW